MIAMIHPRNRFSDVRVPNPGKQIVSQTGLPDVITNFFGNDDFIHKVIGDQINPGWRNAKRNGQVILSPMTMIKTSRAAGGVMSMMISVPLPNGVTRTTQIIGDHSSSGFESNINALFVNPNLEGDLASMGPVSLAKALAKVNGSDMIIGETMADFTKTAMMLRRPFKGATELIGRIIKSRKRSLKKSGSNLVLASSNAWLEHAYGWKPLFIDMNNIVDYAHEKREFKRVLRVARAEERRDSKITSPFSFGALTDPQWARTGTATRRQTSRACSGVIYSLNNYTPQDRLAKLLGSRVVDVPSTAWEMIPFSFVVDWFTNIGPWIRAAVPDPLIKNHGMWTTSVYNSHTSVDQCDFYYSEADASGSYVRSRTPMNLSQWSTEWVQRDVDPNIGDYPVLTVKPLSIPHTLSGLALSAQQIARSMGSLRH